MSESRMTMATRLDGNTIHLAKLAYSAEGTNLIQFIFRCRKKINITKLFVKTVCLCRQCDKLLILFMQMVQYLPAFQHLSSFANRCRTRK